MPLDDAMDKPTNKRCFLGVACDALTRACVTEFRHWYEQQPHTQSLKYSPLENLHVTMRFIGMMTAEQIEQLTERVTEITQRYAQFSFLPHRFLYFPPSRPRMIVITLGVDELILNLVGDLEFAAQAVGFAAESRPYLPHITLARKVHHTKIDLEEAPILLPTTIDVTELILYESCPGEHGSIYVPLHRFPLTS